MICIELYGLNNQVFSKIEKAFKDVPYKKQITMAKVQSDVKKLDGETTTFMEISYSSEGHDYIDNTLEILQELILEEEKISIHIKGLVSIL